MSIDRVKDPAYPDTRYAPGTVNTMPEHALDAVADHGQITGEVVGNSTLEKG